MTLSTGSIDIVRGRMTEELAAELVRFWTVNRALSEPAAQRRTNEAVAVLRDAGGAIAGVNSVYPAELELIGGRRFWIYRSFLAPPSPEAADELLTVAFRALDQEFDGELGRPIGLALLIDDRALMKRRPEAEWSAPPMLYAGYLGDGRQVRVGYFEGARVGSGV